MAALPVTDGFFIKVLVNGTEIANSDSGKFSFKAGSRNVSSKDGGRFKQKEYTDLEASISGSYLHADSGVNTAVLFGFMINRTKFTARFGSVISGQRSYSCTCICTSLDVDGKQNENTTGSYSFESDGTVTEIVNP